MDIIPVGVKLDPSDAQKGAKAVVDAVDNMATKATAAAKKTGAAGAEAGKGIATGAKTAESATAKATSAFGRMAQSARTMASTVSGQFSNMAAAAGMMNNRFGSLVMQAQGMAGAFRGISAGAKASAASFAGMALALGTLLAVVGAAIAAFAALGAAITLTVGAMKEAGTIQAQALGLKTIIGDAQVATQTLEQLREISRKTGADLSSNLDTTIKFTALGFSPSDAVKLQSNISDVAGTLGLSKDRANELANALAQVQAKGVVSMEELRQQIAEKGVPVMEDLAAKIGVTTAELGKLVEGGQVPAKALVDLFLNMEGSFSKFAGGAERATQTLPGAFARLTANWKDLQLELGSPINDAVVPMINRLSDAMSGLRDEASAVGNAIADAVRVADGLAQISFMDAQELDLKGYASGFELVMQAAWDQIKAYASQIMEALGILLENRLKLAVRALQEGLLILNSPEFWSGLKAALIDAAGGFVSRITDGLGPLKNLLGIKTAGDFKGAAAALGLAGLSTAGAAQPKPYDLGPAPSVVSMTQAWAEAGQSVVPTKPIVDLTMKLDEVLQSPAMQPGQGVLAPGQTLEKPAASYTPVELLKGSGGGGGGKSDAEKEADSMRTEANRIIESNMTPQEEYDKQIANLDRLKAAGMLTADQYARAWDKAAEDFKGSSEKMSASVDKMATDAQTPLQRLLGEWSNLSARTQDLSASMTQALGDGVSNALNNIIDGSMSASEAFEEMAASLVADINKMIVRLLVQWAISSAMGMATGIPAVPVMHTGGEVGGQQGATRPVTPGTFTGAPRFAFGGTVPASGETPIIAEPGEHVLTRDQASDIQNRLGSAETPTAKPASGNGGAGVTVINVQDTSEIERYLAQNPQAVLNVIGKNSRRIRQMLA